jgi:hypothetical protein
VNAAPRIDPDDVRGSLRVADVIERYDVPGRRSGGEFRTKVCPACGPRARESVAINLTTGRWHDHAHGCSGDVFALLAALAGIDVRQDFRRVLELAADIAGVEAQKQLGTFAYRALDVARHVRSSAVVAMPEVN